MYIPSAESLMTTLSLSKLELSGNGSIQVPARLLKLLLQIALAATDFNEEGYLRDNPDVAKAIARGEVESARMHYIGFGYFEGRLGAGPQVDEKWYLEKYPDVALAVRDKTVSSAKDHFNAIGAGEGRSPNSEQQDDAVQWKEALRRRS